MPKILQKPDNILRQINRRIDEIAGMFGVRSPEYMSIKAALGTVRDIGVITRTGGKGQPDKLSRSKKVQSAIIEDVELHEQLQDAWNAIKAQGTAKQQKRKYLESTREKAMLQSGVPEEVIEQGIRDAAEREYEANFYDDDVYEKYQDLVEEAAETGDEDLMSDLQDIYNLFKYHPSRGSGDMDWKYNAIVEQLHQAEQDHNDKIIEAVLDDNGELSNFDMSM